MKIKKLACVRARACACVRVRARACVGGISATHTAVKYCVTTTERYGVSITGSQDAEDLCLAVSSTLRVVWSVSNTGHYAGF